MLKAEKAESTANPRAEALPVVGSPRAERIASEPVVHRPVADAYTPPSNPRIALPEIGDVGTPKSAAYQDLVEARADLRQARQQPSGAGLHRRADIREAKRDIRHAKAELQAENSGGGVAPAQDGWLSKATASAASEGWQGNGLVDVAEGLKPGVDEVETAGTPTAADQVTAILNGSGPLEFGHELPQIDQLKPKGNNGSYYNGDMNCGPAALAMIARGNPNAMIDGKPVSHYPDAALINRIGEHADTNYEGTSPNRMIDTAEEMGFQTVSRQGGLNTDFYDQALQQGGSIIANGAYFIGDELAGHFVAVTGKTKDGKYVVNDPLQGRVEWTPYQLDLFLKANPANGGASIACF